MNSNLARQLLLMVLFVACGFQKLTAQTEYEWNGSSDNLWSTAANWTPNGVPGTGDDVVIPGTGIIPAVMELGGNRACNRLVISGGAGFTLGLPGETLTVESGNVSRNYNTTAQHVIACNLVLNSPDGTNIVEVTSGEGYNYPNREVRIEGAVSTTGLLYKTGSAGKLTLTNPNNSIGAGVFIESRVLEVNGITVGEALGAGDITINSITTWNSDALFIRGLDQTVTNTIRLAGTGVPRIAGYDCTVTVASDIEVPDGITLQFGHSGSSLVILDNNITGSGNISINRNATAFTSTNQFNNGNLLIGTAGGIMLFDGITWADLTNHYSSGYGAGARQWQANYAGGFAARGVPLVIKGEGAPGGGAPACAWFDNGRAFGAGVSPVAREYADTFVEIQVNTELTDRYRWIHGGVSPGMVVHDNSRIHRFTGNISDPTAAGAGPAQGVMRMDGVYNNSEFILAGTNDWTGSYCQTGHGADGGGNGSLNSGPGGLITYQGSSDMMLVQFDGGHSLPRGNGGAPAWLSASSRYSGIQGFIFTAHAGGEEYVLYPGYRFLLGWGVYGVLGVTGDDGTSATLRDSAVCLHIGAPTAASVNYLVARGGAELMLGVPGEGVTGAVLFQPSYGFDADNFDAGIDGPATEVSDSDTTRVLITRGMGTLALGNVRYTKVDGTGDTSSQFVWKLGLNSGTFYQGAVRETGADLWNSMLGVPVYLQGGVLELGGGDFIRDAAETPGPGQFRLMNAAGGFAAHGADRVVNINGGAQIGLGDNAVPIERRPHGAYPLIFGSLTANATVNFENPISISSLNTDRYIMAVRGKGAGPEARLLGQITGGGSARLNIIQPLADAGVPLPAGIIEFAHSDNQFAGQLLIQAGTILVSGAINNGTSVIVYENAGLGGSGTIKRNITIQSNGCLTPGNLEVGTLSVDGDLILEENMVYEWEHNRVAGDSVTVTGTLTLPSVATVDVNCLGGPLFTRQTLIEAANLAGALDLSGWTATGISRAEQSRFEIEGTAVIFYPPPTGTMVTFQ